ncbi:hypothetical protein BGP_5981 [Beggiatoa sp. PS]|nr:hypothetical protein BGP_5981 [Beggiatoa sp. PS]
MSDGLNIGDAFLLSTPPNDKHLFVVIAPTQNGKYLCVNVTIQTEQFRHLLCFATKRSPFYQA